MSKEIKNYARYFFNSKRRLLIVEFLILFILLPFLAYNYMGRGNEYAYSDVAIMNTLGTVGVLSLLCAIGLALLTPIYTNRFVFKRTSCDLYFALPIKRGTLYTMQFVLGALFALIPLCINYLIVILMMMFKLHVDIGSLLLFYLILITMFLVLYSLATFLVVKCNNLVDAALVVGAYVILPIVIIGGIIVFLSTQISAIYVANVNVASEIIDMNFLVSVLSLPAFLYFTMVKTLLGVTSFTTMIFMLLVIYWIVIGCLCFYFGRRYFIQRKEEDAQQRTTALPTYPVIINVSMICLILMTFTSFGNIQDMVMILIILFAVYVIMQMFAKRTLRLKPKNFIFFFVIYALTFGFSYLFQSTTGFGLLQEVPNENKIDYAQISFSVWDEQGKSYSYKAPNGVVLSEKEVGYGTNYKKQSSIEKILQLQKEEVKAGEDDSAINGEQTSGSLGIYYIMKDGKKIVRQYTFYRNVDETFEKVAKIHYNELYSRSVDKVNSTLSK